LATVSGLFLSTFLPFHEVNTTPPILFFEAPINGFETIAIIDVLRGYLTKLRIFDKYLHCVAVKGLQSGFNRCEWLGLIVSNFRSEAWAKCPGITCVLAWILGAVLVLSSSSILIMISFQKSF